MITVGIWANFHRDVVKKVNDLISYYMYVYTYGVPSLVAYPVFALGPQWVILCKMHAKYAYPMQLQDACDIVDCRMHL